MYHVYNQIKYTWVSLLLYKPVTWASTPTVVKLAPAYPLSAATIPGSPLSRKSRCCYTRRSAATH